MRARLIDVLTCLMTTIPQQVAAAAAAVMEGVFPTPAAESSRSLVHPDG